ncbi:MAG: glycosyltransferase family 2 protein [Burkholderiaceae bacterium]|nr:MAG: glycosyltransferase family 2 protein [Burkholderiaceae bacterium]
MNTTPPPLSAVIITRNAAAELADCLRSLAFAQEVVVVDSGSTDGTVALAQQLGARVIEKEWLGFGPQKQFAVEQARNDWVLCVDADERISPALQASIVHTLAAPAQRVYRMRRCNRFLGRYLRHGEGYPDWNTRLFDRRAARWADVPVHEHVVSDVLVGDLEGDLLHHSQDTLASYIDKQNRYTTLQANELFARGKKVGALKIVASPLVRFLRFYVFRLGFLDGLPGFAHIAMGSFFGMVKYAKCYALQLSGNKNQ